MECLAWRSLVVVGSVIFTGLTWSCWLCHLASDLDYGEKPLLAYLGFQVVYYTAALILYGGCKLLALALFEPPAHEKTATYDKDLQSILFDYLGKLLFGYQQTNNIGTRLTLPPALSYPHR